MNSDWQVLRFPRVIIAFGSFRMGIIPNDLDCTFANNIEILWHIWVHLSLSFLWDVIIYPCQRSRQTFLSRARGPHHWNFQGPHTNFGGTLSGNTLQVIQFRRSIAQSSKILYGAPLGFQGPWALKSGHGSPACPSFNGNWAKAPLKLWHGWVIISDNFVWTLFTYPYCKRKLISVV